MPSAIRQSVSLWAGETPGGTLSWTPVISVAPSISRGRAACATLRTEGLSPEFLPLDVGEDESVGACATAVARRNRGVDVLISNALPGHLRRLDRRPISDVGHWAPAIGAGLIGGRSVSNRSMTAFAASSAWRPCARTSAAFACTTSSKAFESHSAARVFPAISDQAMTAWACWT